MGGDHPDGRACRLDKPRGGRRQSRLSVCSRRPPPGHELTTARATPSGAVYSNPPPPVNGTPRCSGPQPPLLSPAPSPPYRRLGSSHRSRLPVDPSLQQTESSGEALSLQNGREGENHPGAGIRTCSVSLRAPSRGLSRVPHMSWWLRA